MHILIAPNAFKNSLTAIEAASAIKAGLNKSKLACTTECFGIADGGDGTGELLIDKFNGVHIEVSVSDALGRPVLAHYGLIDDGQTAIIEMAAASGLRVLDSNELQPMIATSFGTGQLIEDALNKVVQKIIVTLGGSATVDGGTGILKALGVRFLNKQGIELNALPRDLISLSSIDTSGLDARLAGKEIIVMCDVSNPILGSNGAARVFGPQKGATPADLILLERCLSRFAEVLKRQFEIEIDHIEMGGSAGGTAAGLSALLHAKLVNGIEYFLDLTSFNNALEKADLLVTGEGSIDHQTLQGKAPYGVAKRARAKGIPVIALAGKVPNESDDLLHTVFDVLLSITSEPTTLDNAIKNTSSNLERTAFEVGNLLALPVLL